MLDLDGLRSGAGFVETSTGDRLTTEQARRLACQAKIIPVVLGGRSEVLDLGRSRRLFTPGPAEGDGPEGPHLLRRWV